MLANVSIRDFRGGKVGYVADAVEQTPLLPEDMADLRSLRRYEVFLSLKRDLAMVSPSISHLFLTLFFSFLFFVLCCNFPLLSSLYYFPLFIFTGFLSSASRSSHVSGRGDNKFLPSVDEGRGRETYNSCGGLPCGRKK